MRVPSVSPRGAVPWVPSNEVQRGNGIGETHEERGKFNFKELNYKRKEVGIKFEELRLHYIKEPS